MPAILMYLLSLNWIYLDDGNVAGWFADQKGKPQLSLYHDRNAKAVAIVQWSNHPREIVPLALIFDKDGFRLQQQEFSQPPSRFEIQQ